MLVKVQKRQAWMTRFFKQEIRKLRTQLAEVKVASGKGAVLMNWNASLTSNVTANATPSPTPTIRKHL